MESLFKAVLFDLDGTLLDTLADIAAAGNHVLATLGLPAIRVERYRHLAGQGAPYLVQKAIGPERQALWERGLEIFKEFQLRHAHASTRPYPGIPELLDELTRRGVVMAVLSNKPDLATRQTIRDKLPRWKFAAVYGHREGVALKPDPAGAFAIAQEVALETGRFLYVGDTSVDMQTAVAAGMFPVGVLWGFRDEAELRDSGAGAIIRHPSELLRFFGS